MGRGGMAVLAAVAAIFAMVWLWRNEAGGDVPEDPAHRRAMAGEPSSPPASVVLSINASKPSPAPAIAPSANQSAIGREFATAKGLKPLYDRLAAQGAAATPDAKYYLYRILSRCATRTDIPADGRVKAVVDQRARLEMQIPATSGDRAKRLALYDQMAHRCDGMETVTTTQADLAKLLSDAAAGGDPKARALVTARELQGPPGPAVPGPDGISGPSVSDPQLRTLEEAIASRDPEAIYIAGAALSSTFRDVVPEIGPNHEELQGRASMEAWHLVACEYGLECGPGSRDLEMACVYTGQCAATTVQDQVFFYGVTPYEAQLLDQYRQVFRNAAANNDWSGITFARRPNTSSSRYSFSPGPP
jgi:hypothetical protein